MFGFLRKLFRPIHPPESGCILCGKTYEHEHPVAPPFSYDDEEGSYNESEKEAQRQIKLGDDIKSVYPEKWQQDTIMRAWNTGKPAHGNRPEQEEIPG